MKAIILAGGLGIGFEPLNQIIPNPLLPIAGKPIIEYQLESMQTLRKKGFIDCVYISTRLEYKSVFSKWKKCFHPKERIEIIAPNDKWNSIMPKLGAIGRIYYVVDQCNIEDDFLVIAGDNIFDSDLKDLHTYFTTKNKSVVAGFQISSIDINKKAERYGIIQTDKDGKIVSFIEKPKVLVPPLSFVSTACYIFNKEDKDHIRDYTKILLKSKSRTLENKLGHLIIYLIVKTDVYASLLGGSWFNVGTIEGYNEANLEYLQIRKK